ncbi:MAG: TolC family protein [Armatimonadota bacterium]
MNLNIIKDFDNYYKLLPGNTVRSVLHSILLLPVLIIFGTGTLFAEDAGSAKLALKDAVTMAIGMNVNLKRADSSRLDSASRLRVAGFNTTYGVNSTTAFDRTPNDTAISSRVAGNITYRNLLGTSASMELAPFGLGNERGSVGLSVRQPLMKGKGIYSDKSELVFNARSSSFIGEKSYYMSRQSTVYDVISAYFSAVEARELVTEQENALTYVEQAAVYARKREEAGLGRGIDVSRAEVRVARNKDQLNLQRSSARAALDHLMITIGAGVGQSYDLTEPVPTASMQMPPIEEALQTALKTRSELSIYDQQLYDQQRALAITKDQLRPAVDVVARYNSVNQDKGIISGSIIDAGSLKVGVEMSLPLDRRIDLEDRNIAERGLDLLQKQRAFRAEQIAEEIRRAYRSIEAANTSLQIYTQNLNDAKENLRIAERMVEEGEGDNRDVLEAQNELTRVTSSIVSARIDLYLASVNLKYAMGEDLTTLGSL